MRIIKYFNQLLLEEGYAEARDYSNEFDPDDWMGPPEYVAIEPSSVRSPLPIPALNYCWLWVVG